MYNGESLRLISLRKLFSRKKLAKAMELAVSFFYLLISERLVIIIGKAKTKGD
jgi:hypothetical protein